MTEPPILISKFDQVLEQIILLTKDIEREKWDAGVTVLVTNGSVDVRGLGTTDTPTHAAALLFMALKSLPSTTQSDMLKALKQILVRSEAVAKEAPLWRPSDDAQSLPPSPGSTHP